MASEGAAAKRANLVASRLQWSLQDLPESLTGSSIQSNVSKWLNSPVTEEDAKQKLQGAEVPVRRNPSNDDDLALGVEASLYGKQGVRTVQRFLWWRRSSSALSRWNSFSSTTSGHSGPLSVMDVLNLWNDDPEEVLLDLGFGCDEPDLSGRIPARFINYQSQARGINLQVFLEAQKNRLDLENPDVSNRFRQLEVLQQVTTAFSSLVGSASTLPPEAQERRRRVGMLFRRASKKSLSQLHNLKAHEPTTPTTPTATSSSSVAPESLQPAEPSLGDKKVPLKKLKPGPLETGCLSPLIEEQGAGPDPQSQPHVIAHLSQEGPLRPGSLRQGHPLRKKSPGHAIESFELEEIQSFDDSTGTGSYTGGAENLMRGVIRTNSCQSDSSGFLEEPFTLPQQPSPGSNLIKALSGLSEGSTESQSNKRPDSPSSSPPCDSLSHLISMSPISSYDLQSSEMETPPHQDQPPSELESQYLPPRSSSSELQNVPERTQSPPVPSPALNIPRSPTSSPMETDIDSLIRDSEDIQTEDKDTPSNQLPTLPHDSEGTEASTFSSVPPSQSPSPEQNCEFSELTKKSDSSSGKPGNSQTEKTEMALDPRDAPDFHCLSTINNQRDPVPTVPSPALNIPRSPMETDIDSLIRDSEDIQTEHKDTPSAHLSTLSHDYEGAEASIFSTVPPSQSPSPEQNCAFSESTEKSDSSSEKPGYSQTEKTELALDACDPPDFHCLSSENNQRDSVFYESDEISVSETQTHIQKEQGETPSSLSFQLDDNNPPAPSPLVEDPTLPPQTPAEAAGGISDMNEQHSSDQGESRSDDDNTDTSPASPVQDVICDKMDHLSQEDDPERNGEGEGEGEVERHTDSVQTRDTAVYISDTESSAALSEGARLASEEVCTQTEIDPPVPSCSLDDELSAKTKQVEVSEGSEMEITGTENESSRNSLTSPEVPEVSRKSEGEQKDLIEIESLDLVFETSVDGSDVDSGDVEAFFKQLDSEGQVYWAEPIQLSSSTPVFTESSSFEASDRSFGRSLSSSGSATLDSVSSTDKHKPSTMDTDQSSRNTTNLSDAPSSSTLALNMSSSTTPDLRPSSRSVSVQMPSSPSSHIVQRKDIPYTIDSKYNFLPSIRPLDTSSPFRAVQEWTDMQIQRNNLLKKLSQGAVHAFPNEASVSVGSSQTIRRPTLIFSSSPSLPLLSNDWESNDCLPGIGRNYHAVSVSVDGGLWLDKDEEVDRNGSEDEEKLWEGNQPATMTCCCSCDHQYACCTQRSYNKQHSQGSMPYSLADLEEMMLCLQQFRSVLGNMEEQLSEDQAAVYSDLSDQDRENIRDIEELRQAVKQEAKELEMQLNELAHYYDHSLKMRMDRLLDEQSLLCSQLGVFQPAAVSTSSSSTPNRTVATQCCLLPCVAPAPDVHSEHASSWNTWNTDSPRQSPPESESACNGLGCSPTKADKLDIVGFLQKMRTSHHNQWENK